MVTETVTTKAKFVVRTLGCLLLIAASLALQSYVWGQGTTATILGTVKDQSGAVLPGATVTATNLDNGLSRTAVSGSRGEYRLINLPPGNYQVHTELSGFQAEVRKGITLSIGSESVIDFTMNVGNITEQVTVTGDAPLVETSTATVSGLVDQNQMRDIPLNGRSFLELVPLQTGAVFALSGQTGSPTQGFGKKLSVVGTRFDTNAFLLDGADINDVSGSSGSAGGTMTGVETVREFRVITNAYDAEYGRHTGAVISAVTKSGTNDIHGSVFEFLRNDNIDAANFFDNSTGKGKPEFKRNQFGATVGGPVRKDRIFYFGSYEGLREGLGLTQILNVPGIAVRRGTVAPNVKPFLDAYPLPTQPDRADGTAQFPRSVAQSTTEDFFTGRGDIRLSDSDSLFARVNTDRGSKATPGISGSALSINTSQELKNNYLFATLEETHIFSPRVLGRTHISFNRTILRSADVGLPGFTFPVFSFDGSDTPGRIIVSGSAAGASSIGSALSPWGGGTTNPKRYAQNLFQYKEDIFWTSGSHALKFGAYLERIQLNDRSGFHDGGTYTFSNLTDFVNGVPNLVDFVAPGSTNVRGPRQNLVGLYAHDDLSLRPGLSLNLGVRYEFITVPVEVNGKVSNIRDITVPRVFSVKPADASLTDPYFRNPSLKNFAPRVGLAWDPFQNGKTSVRAGFGTYYDDILPNAYRSPLGRSAPYYSVAEINRASLAINFPNAYTAQRANLLSSGGAPQYDGIEYQAEQPTVYKSSFGIEQQVAADTTMEIGYSGTRGVHLLRGDIQLNATPAVMQDGRLLVQASLPLLNPNFSRLRWRLWDGTSIYHGLRAGLRKQFSHNLQWQVSYTYSKVLDDGSNYTGTTDYNDSSRNGYRTAKDYGLAAFDVRHNLSANFVYDLPGSHWTGVAGKLLGGWNLSGVFHFNGGYPLSAIADQDRRIQFVTGSTLDLVAGGKLNPVNPQNPDHYFDRSQFVLPPCVRADGFRQAPCVPSDNSHGAVVSTFAGNVGKNNLITPGIANMDVTLIKETVLPKLGEKTKLQFRAEFFNLLNRPNFGPPANNLFTNTGAARSDAGLITSTNTSSRQLQFALKVVF